MYSRWRRLSTIRQALAGSHQSRYRAGFTVLLTLLFLPAGLLVPAQVATALSPSPIPSGTSGSSGITPCCGGSGYLGTSLSDGASIYGGDYLLSPDGSYKLILQSDGNLVLYYNGGALWASGTTNASGDHAVLQGDGNFVIYQGGTALWNSHTGGSGGDVLNVQNDGNVVIYLSNTALWNTATSANQRDCWTSDSCSPSDFAWELLGVTPQAPYPGGVNVWPLTLPNNYAVYTWTRAENTPLSIANPLATTQLEPGSYDYNPPAHVQVYTDSSGHTKWYWGIKATSDTVHNGFYQPIINVVQNPSSSSYQQCVNLGHAVGSTPWGTGDFSGDC